MRLKTFSAPTMSIAMARVRDSLGDEAIIVSTRNGGTDQGVTVVAAAERQVFDYVLDGMADSGRNPVDVIDQILHFHRTPPEISDPLRRAVASLQDSDSETSHPVALLAGALDMQFKFKLIDPATLAGPVVMVGAPGSGKTVAAAKLAAAVAITGRPVRLITTDGDRAGAAARLQALGERIAVPVQEASNPETLQEFLPHGLQETVIIDTPGVNPLDEEEIALLRQLIGDVRGQIMHVIPAGYDAFDAAEQANAFAGIGANVILASRLDTGVRYGALLAAAQTSRLPFVFAGIRPQIGEGLVPLNPMSLARLMAARCDGSPSPFDVASWAS